MRYSLLFATALTLCASAAPASLKPLAPRTIASLKEAYKGETTARSKYTAYAAKADVDGKPAAARLFRAAALAETIHAHNHKVVLAKMGVADPAAGTYRAKPGPTRENLKDAVKGETYEKDSMYPRMLKDAAAEKQVAATQTFDYAMEAEGQHAALYKAALKENAPAPAADYKVCPVCGGTYAGNAVPAVCTACGTPKGKFRSQR